MAASIPLGGTALQPFPPPFAFLERERTEQSAERKTVLGTVPGLVPDTVTCWATRGECSTGQEGTSLKSQHLGQL